MNFVFFYINTTSNLYLDSELKQLHDSITRLKVEVETLMKNVRDDYGVNIEPKYELIQKYIEERDKIDQSVFRFKSKLIDFKKKNKDLFFSQFLDKLSKEIEKYALSQNIKIFIIEDIYEDIVNNIFFELILLILKKKGKKKFIKNLIKNLTNIFL